MTTIELPFPPSTNSIWRNARSRTIKSDRYREWANAAGWALKQQRPRKVKGQVHITLCFEEKDERRRDLDNLVKAALDLLVAHRVIEGDDSRYVRAIDLRWGNCAGCRVTIEQAGQSDALPRI